VERKILSSQELLDRKEELIEKYNAESGKSRKMMILSKRERKVLGIGRDQGKATLNYARIAPSKVKIVLDLIKGKSLAEAYAIVRFTPKAASELIFKLLKSAEANAVNNFELDGEKLYVAECYANQGPTLKRMRAAARGRGSRINKKTSHITVVLKERD
jgi:large subunit ribosomal protein L22